MEIKTFNLGDSHIKTIKSVAAQNGDTGDSAALRYIIEDWQRRVERERKQVPARAIYPHPG